MSDEGRGDAGVERLVGASRVVRTAEHVGTVFAAAIRSSVTASVAIRWTARWRQSGWRWRRRSIGAVLLIAVCVHAALVWGHGPPPGWMWAILPGLMAAAGGLFLVASIGSEPGPTA